MPIIDPWKAVNLENTVTFADYLSGQAAGGNFQSQPAFFQRGIEWDEPQISAALLEIFPSNLDFDLYSFGKGALNDAWSVHEKGRAIGGTLPKYERGTSLARSFFHDIDIQAIGNGDEREVAIIDGQQRTTFWRCAAMFFLDSMIEHGAPVVPKSLSDTICTPYMPTMTFGENASYDQLSKPFCIDWNRTNPQALALARQKHLDVIAFLQPNKNSSDSMMVFYRKVRIHLKTLLERLAKQGSEDDSKTSILSALYAMSTRMLFDCEVRVNVLPKDLMAGKHYNTKNSRGKTLSEHALVISALFESGQSSAAGKDTSKSLVTKWKGMTAVLQEAINARDRKKGTSAENRICLVMATALLTSHKKEMIELSGDYISSLTDSQKSNGAVFQTICALMERGTFNAWNAMNELEKILPIYIAVSVDKLSDQKIGLDSNLLGSLKLLGKSSLTHAVFLSKAFECSQVDTNDLMKILIATTAGNSVYEAGADSKILDKIGRVGASLNHAISSCSRTAVKNPDEAHLFAQNLGAKIVHSEDGNSPYYDKSRHKKAMDVLHEIPLSNNNVLRTLLRVNWFFHEGAKSTLQPDNEIEHILPVRPSENAFKEACFRVEGGFKKAKDDPSWQNVTSLIGNRTWLPKTTNTKISNKCFSEKKAILLSLQQNGEGGLGVDGQELATYSQFRHKEILERGKMISSNIQSVFDNWIGLAKKMEQVASKQNKKSLHLPVASELSLVSSQKLHEKKSAVEVF